MKRNLLAAEYRKLWKSGMMRIWIGMIVWILIATWSTLQRGKVDLENGYRLAAEVYFSFGLLWFWLNSAVAVFMVTREYETGTIRNMFVCGVERKQVFSAKMFAVFSADLIFVAAGSLAYVLMAASRDWEGFLELLSGEYMGQLLTGMLFLALVTTAELLFSTIVGVLSGNSIITVVVTVVATIAETFLWSLVRKKAFTPDGAILAYFFVMRRKLWWKDFVVPAVWAAAGFWLLRRIFQDKEI